jgi:hypothetical protein
MMQVIAGGTDIYPKESKTANTSKKTKNTNPRNYLSYSTNHKKAS